MNDDKSLSLEERRKKMCDGDWEEVSPEILMIKRCLGYSPRFVHLCSEVSRIGIYGGFLDEGKCHECGFIPKANLQFTMKLLKFKG
jgi:hypothetical protein